MKLMVAQPDRSSEASELGATAGGTMKVTRPQDFHRSYAEAFNSGDIQGLLDHYERDASVVPATRPDHCPGTPRSGRPSSNIRRPAR